MITYNMYTPCVTQKSSGNVKVGTGVSHIGFMVNMCTQITLCCKYMIYQH